MGRGRKRGGGERRARVFLRWGAGKKRMRNGKKVRDRAYSGEIGGCCEGAFFVLCVY